MKISVRESVGTHTLLVIAVFFAVYPLGSIIISSLQKASGPGIGWGNFSIAWNRGHFASALISSALVAASVVLITAIISCLAGYALATMRVPGGRLILGVLLVGLVLPYEVTVLPLYQMLSGWGLINTYWALILPQIGLSVPLGVFWMRAFFRSVPEEILEAARLDGASRLQTLRLALLPIAGPAIATLSTILFLFTWNEFLLALILIPDNQAVQTAPLALSFFSGTDRSSNPYVTAAAAVLVAVPIIIAYVVLQRRLITGLTSGAVK
ncbi:carbohydrate ABC transporter permease [Glaciihabitans sp. UYNi722]|uniref:carbohydrate ABC transporter permease n=1 Tax=Glaciihabitans sp. UYNi722 TaxID=3156344 RepID=UPI0033946135